ncbi:macrophage metalloelastase-like isoform X2 [Paroedura picta]
MQEFLHVPKTGEADDTTLEVMNRPRCGNPDVLEYNRVPGNNKWDKNDLTYRINNYTSDMAKEAIRAAIEKAFSVWAAVTPLRFQEVTNETADIEIWFSVGEHGDFNKFDGRGGTLAHAFSAGPNLGGDCHMDDDEKWSEKDNDINLFVVILHELGHSLGMGHSDDPEALMYPTYSYKDPETFELPLDDKEGIQSIYGPNPDAPDDTEQEYDNTYADYNYRDEAPYPENWDPEKAQECLDLKRSCDAESDGYYNWYWCVYWYWQCLYY